MAKRVQIFRGAATVVAQTVLKTGELMANLTRKSLHIGDGATPGGTELARADLNNVADASASAPGRMSVAQATTVAALHAPEYYDRTALSGTSVDIPVPTWARRITLFLHDLPYIAGTTPIVQLNSGGIISTLYSGAVWNDDRDVVVIYNDNGKGLPLTNRPLSGSATVLNGTVIIEPRRIDSSIDYQWQLTLLPSLAFDSAAGVGGINAGFVWREGLTQEHLDGVRLTYFNGSASFTGGYVSARFDI